MKCVLVATDDGHLLRDQDTNEILFGPTFSLGALSNYTRDNRITIVARLDETSAATASTTTQKAPAEKAGAGSGEGMQ